MDVDALKGALRTTLRQEALQPLLEPGLRPAAVLILLYERNGEYHIVLTQRSMRVADHRGEMSLPGGAQDSGETLARTALREAQEEIGLDPASVELLGTLETYVSRSNYAVTPFVGLARGPVHFRPQEREVAAIVEIPLAAFSQPGTWVQDGSAEFAGHPVLGEYYRYGPYVIWGLTYRILNEFLELAAPLGITVPSPSP